MGCFGLYKANSKKNQERKSATNSAPISTDSYTSSGKQTTSKSSGSTSSQQSVNALYEERVNNLRVFQLNELINATNGFNRTLKIGEGGFGSVYKGLIMPSDGSCDKISVAIKRLNEKGLQGHKEFLAEVQFLGVVNHRNLVKLIGYCAEDNENTIQRLLVYEFMPNKSLEDHLFSRAYPCIPWNLRLQIALGAAEGLAYLHEGLENQVNLHIDIAANIYFVYNTFVYLDLSIFAFDDR